MELILPRPAAGAQELKQELFLRAEELERLVAMYKLKLCSDDMNSLSLESKLMEQRNTSDATGSQRGHFYDVYMKKREVKLREERRVRGVKKEEEMRALLETLATNSSAMMNKSREFKTDPSRLTESRKISSIRSIPPSVSQSKENTNPSNEIGTETTPPRSFARSKSSNNRPSLARRSLSLHKSSASLGGEQKDFKPPNSDTGTSTTAMIAGLSSRAAPKPSLLKSNSAGPASGLNAAKQKISMADSNPRLGQDSRISSYHRFESTRQSVQVPESRNLDMQSFLSDGRGASDFDSSADSPRSGRSMEGKTVRARKKWGSVERLFAAMDASNA